MMGGCDAAGPVALHPAVPGKGEAGEPLAEVLHHVVALELAVDGHVHADLILPANGVRGQALKLGIVRGLRDLAAREASPQGPDLRRLRPGADGGHGQRRQAEPRGLGLRASRVRTGAPLHPRRCGSEARRHGRVVQPGVRPCLEQGAVALGERRRDRTLAFVKGPCECRDLGQLLIGEGQAPTQRRVEARFHAQAVRHVEQRARRCDDQPPCEAGIGRAPQGRERHAEVRPPHVAAIDHAER